MAKLLRSIQLTSRGVMGQVEGSCRTMYEYESTGGGGEEAAE